MTKKRNIFNIKTILENKWLILIILLFLIIKILFITLRYHFPIWDEGVYIGMGKYIFSAGNSGLLEIFRPLGIPLLSGFTWIIGLDQLLATQIIEILFACGNILLVYLITKKLFNSKIALLSAFLLAISPIFFLYSIYILTEIPSTFFVLLSIYFYINNKYLFSGISAAIAMLFRFPQGLIVAAIIITIIINNKKIKEIINKSSKFIAGFVIITIPYLIMNYFIYRTYTSGVINAMFEPFISAAPHQNNIAQGVLDGTLSSNIYNIFYYVIIIFNNNVFFILAILGIILLIRNEWKNKNARIILITLLIYLIYFTYIIIKQERFALQFLPLICILTAYGFFKVYDHLKKQKNITIRKTTTIIALAFLIMTSIYVINKDIRYYTWLYTEKPDIIENYEVINDLSPDGPIIISDPVIAVYSDYKMIGLYLYKLDNLLNSDLLNDLDGELIIYSDNAFYCAREDIECVSKRDMLFKKISTQYTLQFNQTYLANKYYIFSKNIE